MASFKSDAQGFLVGELVTSTRDMLRSQQQGMSVWKAIRADVKSIARGAGQPVKRSKPVRPSRRRNASRAHVKQRQPWRTVGGIVA
jgi:hypothetical protein